jgi:lipopolysaccharide assembly outer membrane protein LptD (OstA)
VERQGVTRQAERGEAILGFWFGAPGEAHFGAFRDAWVKSSKFTDLEAGTTIFHKFGLIYTHPCLQLAAGVERRNTNDRDAEDTTTISFRVTFKNLGEIGADADLFGAGG